MGQSTPGSLCPTFHSSSVQFIKCPVGVCFDLVIWYPSLLYIALCILQFLCGPNWARIRKNTLDLNNIQLII